jgi:hypothetical protein
VLLARHLIDKMCRAHQRGGDMTGWLPLLAQTQAAIEAVEAAMRESLTRDRGRRGGYAGEPDAVMLA